MVERNIEQKLADINLALETLEKVNKLFEITPELQERENRAAINEFRDKVIRKVLSWTKEISRDIRIYQGE